MPRALPQGIHKDMLCALRSIKKSSSIQLIVFFFSKKKFLLPPLPQLAIYFVQVIPPHFYLRGLLFLCLWLAHHLETSWCETLWHTFVVWGESLKDLCFCYLFSATSMDDVTNTDGSLRKGIFVVRITNSRWDELDWRQDRPGYITFN